MDRKTLERKLLCYRSDRARAEYLRRYIPLMEKRLSELKEEALQGIGRALPPDAVRVSCGPGDPTGRLAVRAAEDALTEEMRLCRDQLNGLRREAAALDAHLSLMECLLASLTEESRFLLTARYLDRVSWPELARRYQERYRVDYVPLTLRRRCAHAMDALCGTCERTGPGSAAPHPFTDQPGDRQPAGRSCSI